MQTQTKTDLPRILCLHGAGSSAAIYKVQAREIIRALHSEFEFVFVDAPFPSAAGPGMRPTFEDSGPFWRWQCDLSAAEAFDITAAEILEERDKVRTQLSETIRGKSAQQGLKQPFVGIMGFSQGARLATGLLLHQARQKRQRRETFCDLKFAIINSVTYPALFLEEDMSEGDQKVEVPTIHLHGSVDPWRPEAEKMHAELFAPELSTVIEYTGGHLVPTRAPDSGKVVKAIRRVAAETMCV